jgi:hypothetical protein
MEELEVKIPEEEFRICTLLMEITCLPTTALLE